MASPFTRTFSERVAGAAAADATRDDAVLVVPFAGNITAVTFVPDAALSGANTNNRQLSLINKGLTGGDTRVAATLALATGVDLVAFDEKAITVSGTAANVAVVEGDVLALSTVKNGSGLTTPGGQVKISIVATD